MRDGMYKVGVRRWERRGEGRGGGRGGGSEGHKRHVRPQGVQS